MIRRPWAYASAVLLAAAVIVPGASPANAARCTVKGATLVKGALNEQTGFPEHDSAVILHPGATLRRSASYRAVGPSVIQWFQSTASLTGGTIAGMSCYALAVGDPADNPSLSIMHGTATVHAAGGHPLAILTIPALVGPAPQQVGDKLHFTVSEHHSDTKPPTTHVHAIDATPWINVTPYTGPQPGSCRHAISATLIDGANGGSASYQLAH